MEKEFIYRYAILIKDKTCFYEKYLLLRLFSLYGCYSTMALRKTKHAFTMFMYNTKVAV